jgi:glycerol-3-phosphate acyltransferase PlsY
MHSPGYWVSMPSAHWIEVFIGSFLIGSIPFGLFVGRFLFASDLRKSGSGNIGAANALRSYGAAGGATVLLLDAAKGYIPVAYADGLPVSDWLLSWSGHVLLADANSVGFAAFAGLLAVLGHCYSPWLKFKGGKGVATWLGALFALSWIAGIAFVAIWLAIVVPTRYASLGSIGATLLSPIVLWFATPGLNALFAVLVALVIVWQHRENIVRLREGRENKISLGRTA